MNEFAIIAILYFTIIINNIIWRPSLDISSDGDYFLWYGIGKRKNIILYRNDKSKDNI